MKQYLAAFLGRLLGKHLKVWGVEFETNLPPEFVITEHARIRIRERIGCVDDVKVKRLAVKAWHSKDSNRKIDWAKNRYEYFGKERMYRELMGKVYVFAYGDNDRRGLEPTKVLVTVI